MFKVDGELYYSLDFHKSWEKFSELWERRDKRDLINYPIHDFEKHLYNNIFPAENHLPNNTRSILRVEDPHILPDTGHYNFAGPGTHFYTRLQGSETYKEIHGRNLVGHPPYDEPINKIDLCALLHDFIYTNPLSFPEDVTSSDIKLRECWKAHNSEYSNYQKALTLASSGVFSIKNFGEKRFGKEGSLSASKQREKYESPELIELETLRDNSRKFFQSKINEKGRKPMEPIEIKLPEKFKNKLISIGLKMDVPASDLYLSYGDDIIAFSQLLRILFTIYDYNRKLIMEREKQHILSRKKNKPLLNPLLSEKTEQTEPISGGSSLKKKKKSKKTKKNKYKKKRKNKKKHTKRK